MARKNKKFTIISAEEIAEINFKAGRSAHREMMNNTSVRGEVQGKTKYSRKEKYKPKYY
jgi:hypothetical protein